MRFPVYASIMLFPHPSASKSASGFMLFTRCLPRSSNELANITATLGSFYWLGFETSGLSPDKKRLAYLGAQRISPAAGSGVVVEVETMELLPVGSDDLLASLYLFTTAHEFSEIVQRDKPFRKHLSIL